MPHLNHRQAGFALTAEEEDNLGFQDDELNSETNVLRSQNEMLQAEVRRLTAELRAAHEAKIDQETTQLAIEHGFLSPTARTPTSRLYSSTPIGLKSATAATPGGLNASAMLDDPNDFSFEGWNTPGKGTPTSRLFSTPFRPKVSTMTPARAFRVSTPQATAAPPSSTPPPAAEAPTSPETSFDLPAPISPPSPNAFVTPKRTPIGDASQFQTPLPMPTRNAPWQDTMMVPQPQFQVKTIHVERRASCCESLVQFFFLAISLFLCFMAGVLLATNGPPDVFVGAHWRPS